MSDVLCISVTFLDARFHGRADGGEPEWPPSPLRLFQAIVAANGDRLSADDGVAASLRWIERQPPPTVVTPNSTTGQRVPVYVPNNAMDLPAKAWARGDNSVPVSTALASHKAMKPFQPTHLIDGQTVHYLWPGAADDAPFDALSDAVGRLIALGWGIDLAVAQARRIEPNAKLAGNRWVAAVMAHGTPLRLPTEGTLDALIARHQRFLHRLDDSGFQPVPPLSAYRVAHYHHSEDPITPAYRLFELRTLDGTRYRHPPAKLMHLAGAVRHMAIERMQQSPPPSVPADWVKVFVAGHIRGDGSPHRQLSYVPLPSVGHRHADPGVRRFMLVAPRGDEAELDHIGRHLAGQRLEPDPRYPDTFGTDEAGRPLQPLLVPMSTKKGDKVTQCYTRPDTVWHSFTPVILPGHDDGKRGKRRQLIRRALAQAGIATPCEFEWSAVPRFPKSYAAYKSDRTGRPRGFLRPDHLLSQTAVHLTLRFGRRENPDDPASPWKSVSRPVPGPFVIGAGRHYGLGLMVAHAALGPPSADDETTQP